MSNQPKHFYDFGPFRLDPEEQTLLRDGRPVPLTPKAFETLVVLVRNRGHVLERDELIKQIWPDAFVEEIGLARNISVLRKALGGSGGASGQQYIETVSKRGYRFVAEVTEVHDETAEPLPGQQLIGEEPGAGRDQVITSLAVLPLVNASADPQTEYLSDGITESIINSLSQLPQLRVMARSTVFRYKGRESDAQTVGRELNVGAVLVGRVLHVGERLVISTELVDVTRGWHLWGEQYNRKASDIFAVQAEIAREISEKLLLKLTAEEKQRLAKRYTENTEAYQAYLRGRYFWNKRLAEGFKKGIEHFQQAIDLDPSYALAYAGLADSYAVLGSFVYGVLPPREAMPKARAAAVRALEIDDTLAEAHASLAFVKEWYEWDWPGAEEEYRRAIALNPSYATAHQWYGIYLAKRERFVEAIAEIKRAQEFDPLSFIINTNVGWILYFARQDDQAIEQGRKMLEIDTSFYAVHWLLGLAFVQKRMYEEAIAQFQKASALSGGSPLQRAFLGHAYAVSGRRGDAQKVLEELERLSEERYFPAYFIALIYAGLGDRDRAFEWLEKTYEEHSGGLGFLKAEPMFDSLRSDTRFADLLRRVGLAP